MDSSDPETRTTAAIKVFASVVEECVYGKSTVEDTVKSILTTFTSHASSKPGDDDAASKDFAYALWTSLIGLVQAVPDPYVSGQLSDKALATLKKFRDILDSLREAPQKYDDTKSATYLATLPDFPIVVRDRIAPDKALKQINTNTFLALLWSRTSAGSGYTEPGVYDYGLYSIWALRAALEEEQKYEVLQSLLPSAASYIFICAHIIAKNERQFGGGQGKLRSRPAKPGPLFADALREAGNGADTAGDGFSPARWAFWKSRLEVIAGEESSDDDVRAIAKAAVDKMEEQSE